MLTVHDMPSLLECIQLVRTAVQTAVHVVTAGALIAPSRWDRDEAALVRAEPVNRSPQSIRSDDPIDLLKCDTDRRDLASPTSGGYSVGLYATVAIDAD